MTWQTRLMDIEFDAMTKGIEKGREEGMEKGREEGLRTLVETLHALSQSQEAVQKILVDKFRLSDDAAREKVAQYWT